jgi:hypothetical protein
MTRTTGSLQWVVGTAVVCVLALVASWLLLLGPMLDGAQAIRDQAAQLDAGNDALRASVEALRDDFAHLDQYSTELAALRSQLPSEARLSDLTREVAAAATTAGVTVVGLDVAAAVTVDSEAIAAAGEAAAAAATAAGTAAATPAGGDAAAATAGAAATATVPSGTVTPPPVEGMIAVPLTITVAGSVEPARAFLTQLQTGLQRQLLVTTLSVQALEEAQEGTRLPATALGDVEVTIGAYAYVVPTDETGTAAEPPVAGATLPAAPGTSPFSPSVEAPAPQAPDPAKSVADAVAEAITQANAQAAAQAEAAAQAQAAAAAAQAQAAAAAEAMLPADGTSTTLPLDH